MQESNGSELKPMGQNRLDDQEHIDAHELEEKLRQPFRGAFAVEVEIDMRTQRPNLLEDMVKDALTKACMRVTRIEPIS